MLIQGDAALIPLPDKSVDAVVTDPPYGLSFMGKDWDHGVPGIRFWKEALRVAKPGCHLLAFGSTRTFHRLAVAIEDAGWVIRDTVGWIYGSGFPKSHNVGKAIDKAAGAEREVVGKYELPDVADGRRKKRWDCVAVNDSIFGASGQNEITAPATEAAKQWDGWGTALKPAWEPVIVARKSFKGTVASNVLEHGTGAINIDGCRVEGGAWTRPTTQDIRGGGYLSSHGKNIPVARSNNKGRWPANIIHDGSDEVVEVFPVTRERIINKRGGDYSFSVGNTKGKRFQSQTEGVASSAARFFYCAKASKKERGEDNKHPTVKPIALMRYLCRLVTPPNGIVFDPFMGSGSTGVAAIQEGFEFIGCDIEAEYIVIAKKRIEAAMAEGIQLALEL